MFFLMVIRVGLVFAAVMGLLLATPARALGIFMLLFGSGSAVMDAEAKVILDNAAAYYLQGGYTVVVSGHADRVGSMGANLRLSRRRAEAVRAGLLSRGMPASCVRTEANGESNPNIDTRDGVTEPQNRAVAILILGKCDARTILRPNQLSGTPDSLIPESRR